MSFEAPLARFKGALLERLRFQHPLYGRTSLGVLADYVTLDAGTGAVHTAPGHGADDFNTGIRYGLDIYAPVGPAGHFLDTVETFAGQRVFDANPAHRAALKERARLWHREDFTHQYPHCWRCHNPVIFLATSQWFIRMDGDPVVGAAAGVKRCARPASQPIDEDVDVDSGLGARPHLQHAGQPPRLVHLAPARLGRADPCARLRRLRRSDADRGAGRASGPVFRSVRRRRLV